MSELISITNQEKPIVELLVEETEKVIEEVDPNLQLTVT